MKNTHQYHNTVQQLRAFFLNRGMLEVPVQSRLSILAACEDPSTVSLFNYENQVWPLPQTGQMWLEHELLKNPNENGFFCISTSYRNEENPIPGRHDRIFPMFEFECKGDVNDLIQMENDLVNHLGIMSGNMVEASYEDVSRDYDASILEYEHEERLCKENGRAVALKDFPIRTSPFWNMKCDNRDTGIYRKVDVIIDGIETIGSAERAVDVDEMREDFYTISDGGYANLLFEKFGKERVERELEEYFSNEFFPRYGGGIGMTRMAAAVARNR